MDLQNAENGVILDIDIFSQFLGELYGTGAIPSNLDLGNQDIPGQGRRYVKVLLNQPKFELRNEQTPHPYTRLHIAGTIELRPEGEPEADVQDTMPLDAWVKLTFFLRSRGNDVPTLGLRYDGIDGIPDPLIVFPALDQFMRGNDIQQLLDSVDIPLFDSIVDALEGTYFTEDNAPDRKDWEIALSLLPGNDGFVDALAGFVAQPGQPATPGIDQSFLPQLMGFGIIHSRKVLNTALASAAKEQEGRKLEGATIISLSLEMEGDGIHVDGHAESGGADIDFEGPMKLFLIRGTTDLEVDTSDVEVDVTKPWYYYLGLAAAGLLFFIPVVGWLVDGLWLVPALAEAAAEAEEAPSKVRRGLGQQLGEQLDALANGFGAQYQLNAVTVESTPDHSLTEDGNILLFAQVFVSPITERLVNAVYAKTERRFMEYQLESGRKFRYSELARLVNIGKITVPGHHDVAGEYMRSNPDDTKANNLLDVFGPH